MKPKPRTAQRMAMVCPAQWSRIRVFREQKKNRECSGEKSRIASAMQRQNAKAMNTGCQEKRLVPGRDSTVRKMVKPKAIRCAKIPLPLRSQRVSLGSLAGAGTRPTSMECIAVPGRPAQSSYQRLLPGLRSRRRRRLQERLLPGEAAGPCGGGAHSALCRVGGKRLGPKGRLPETSTDLIELPTHLHSIFVSIRVSQEVCENYIGSN